MCGVQLCALFEGFRSTPYKCSANVWTIGFGSTFYSDGRKVTPNDPAISKDDAWKLYINLITKQFWKPMIENIPVIKTWNQNEQGALLSFSYNFGFVRLGSGGCDTLDRAIKANDKAAIVKALPLYDNQNTLGLVRRRAAEVWMFEGMDAKTAYTESQRIGE